MRALVRILGPLSDSDVNEINFGSGSIATATLSSQVCTSSKPDMPEVGSPGFNYHSLAHVVRGILDMSGLKFDQDGRLI
jgi:hypothetical protein